MEYDKKNLPYDVVVVGGGPAGMMAALAAGREGLKVVVVERQGYLGGNLASGLPPLSFLDRQGNRIVGGLAEEFIKRMSLHNPTIQHRECPLHVSTTNLNPFLSRIVLFEMARDYKVELLLHAEIEGVVMDNNTIKKISVLGKGHKIEIEGKVFIDGTGDGDLAFLSGENFEKGFQNNNKLQPASLMFNLGGFNTNRFCDFLENNPEQIPYGTEFIQVKSGYTAEFFRNNPGFIFLGCKPLIMELKKSGECPIDRDTIIVIKLPDSGEVAINTIRVSNVDGSDLHDLSRSEADGHLQILPLINMLKKHVPGFENTYLTFINPVMGVRESRRFEGVKQLSSKSILDGDIPEDSIGLLAYFIDIHDSEGNGTTIKDVEKPYGMPFGCLIPKHIDGLFLTGRCISVDSEAFGSSRVMPMCMMTGEAAGIGAAIAIKKNIKIREIEVQEVREKLREYGAILNISDENKSRN